METVAMETNRFGNCLLLGPVLVMYWAMLFYGNQYPSLDILDHGCQGH